MSDNKLTRIKDEAIISSLLTGAKDSGFEVYIWKLIGSVKHLGQVKIESIRKTRKDFCIIPQDGQAKEVQDLMSAQSHIDLYIPGSALLLRCEIKQTEAPVRYYLHMPKFVAQAERRKSLRLNVYEDTNVKICFAKTVAMPRPMTQHFLKSCVDISTGGFSFYVSKMEAKFFQSGDAISSVEVKMMDWSAKLNCQITQIMEVDPNEYNGLSYKVWRVCCKFSSIDQISRKYIDRYILERIKTELHAING